MNIEHLIVCLGFMLLAIALTGWWLGAHYLSTAWFKPENLKAQLENLPLVKIHVRNKDGAWEEKALRMAADDFMSFTMTAQKVHMLAWSAFGSIALVCLTIVAAIALSLGSNSKENATETPKDRPARCGCCQVMRSGNATAGNADSRPANSEPSLASQAVPPKPVTLSVTLPASADINKPVDVKTP